jgi:hypothetical protein
VFCGPFIAQSQSPGVVEPAQRLLDDVARSAQAAAGGLVAAAFDERADASSPQFANRVLEPVSGIALQYAGLRARSAAWALQLWESVQQRGEPLIIALIGRSDLHDQRQSHAVRQQMAFAAFFGTIGGVRPGVRPPKTARTLALSTTTRLASIRPAVPNRCSSFRWMAGHTPALVQSRRRRQQVTPLPQPISAGRRFHAIPERSTKTIPTSAWRASTE